MLSEPRLPSAARSLIFRAGGLTVLRAMNRRGARIIAYHRFPPSSAATLRAQCRYLRESHRVTALQDIDRWHTEGVPLPAYAVAVTVDDGYRDFYRVAYPIFRDHGIPVTVFLTTGFLDRSCWLWCDLVTHLFRHTPLRTAEIRIGAATARFSLGSEAERLAAAFTIKEVAKRLDHEARSELVARQLPSELQLSAPDTPTAEYEPLTWDEVREMYANGVRFGAHTETHPILSSIRSESRLASEIAGSKRRIEDALGHSVSHFAYPNGTLADVNPDVIRCVKKAGFSSAFLAEPGVNRRSVDRYALRRNTTEPVTPLPFFGRNILRST